MGSYHFKVFNTQMEEGLHLQCEMTPVLYMSGMCRNLNFFEDVKPKFTEVIAMPFIDVGSHTELEVNLYNLALINPLVTKGCLLHI